MSEELLKELEVKKQCASCVHWHNQDEMNLISGSCRRFPPQVISSQEFLWPRLAHDSFCGEYIRDQKKVDAMKAGLVKHIDDEKRTADLARTLLEKANAGELAAQPAVEPSENKLDSSVGAQLQPGKPQFAPVLTVARMKALQGARK